MNTFQNFGQMSVRRLCGFLFWSGTIIAAIFGYWQGRAIYLTAMMDSWVQQGEMQVYNPAPNWPLVLLTGMAVFVGGTLIWRLVCECIFIVLNYFKSNTKAAAD